MHTDNEFFTQDTADPIRIRTSQDLTGLEIRIRTRNMDTGAEREGPATMVSGDPYAGERDVLADEIPDTGGLYYSELIARRPGSPVRERTYPGPNVRIDGPPIIIRFRPRRTQVPAPPTPATP